MHSLVSHTFYLNFVSQLINESMIQLQFAASRVTFKEGSPASGVFVTVAGARRQENSDQDITVYVSPLTESDYKFRHQSSKGLPVDHEYAIFAARAVDFDQVLFQVKLTDESGIVLASGEFALVNQGSSQGAIRASLTNGSHEVASIVLDYSLIHPFKPYDSSIETSQYSTNGAIAWKNRSSSRPTVHSGHRGLGVGTRYNVSTYHSICENTIASFDYACECGGQMVELDISLTRDKVIPVFHDLQLRHEETSQMCSIKELSYEDILSHEYQPIDHGKGTHLAYRNESNLKLTLFPKLRQVFQSVHANCAMNVEVKSPYPMQSDEDAWYPHEPIDLNEYVDRILTEVLLTAGDREVVFSSFSPDVCSALRLKQRKYPVLQLTGSGLPQVPPTRDERRSPAMGILWAAASDVEGVNCYGEWVLDGGLTRANFIKRKLNLILYAWQGSLSVSEINRLIDYDLDGLCYDLLDLKIGSTKKRRRGSVENEDESSKLDYETLSKRGHHLIAPNASRNSSAFKVNPDSSATTVDLISNKSVIVQT